MNKEQYRDKVASSLAGEYQFDLKSLFKQAWHTPSEYSWIIRQVVLLTFAIAIVLVVAMLNWFGVTDPVMLTHKMRFGIEITITLVLAPLFCAIMMIGIKQSVRQPTKSADLFAYLPRILVLSLASILMLAIVQLGMMLLFLPGLYLGIATGFTYPLIIERKMSPVNAVLLSIKLVNRYWLDFIKLYAVFMLMFAFSAFTLGIALIWVIPLYYQVKGILYRDMVGVVGESIDNNHHHETTFNA